MEDEDPELLFFLTEELDLLRLARCFLEWYLVRSTSLYPFERDNARREMGLIVSSIPEHQWTEFLNAFDRLADEEEVPPW